MILAGASDGLLRMKYRYWLRMPTLKFCLFEGMVIGRVGGRRRYKGILRMELDVKLVISENKPLLYWNFKTIREKLS